MYLPEETLLFLPGSIYAFFMGPALERNYWLHPRSLEHTVTLVSVVDGRSLCPSPDRKTSCGQGLYLHIIISEPPRTVADI